MKVLKHILLVEDDPDIQSVAKLSLEMLGNFTVKICSSGEQALYEIKTFVPDLVLMDVMMPGMDGPATLKNMRKIGLMADVPVIFMTAKVQYSEVSFYKSLGAIDVIAKPFDAINLSVQVSNAWKKACIV